jgi:Kef-type K+ transport system membrane component KefB/nucleotide-binding universal stress UspA family protein
MSGIVVPFVCGFILGEYLPDSMLPRPELRIITSLFLGTALSIASIKIVAMVVREMNYMRRNLGQIIVSSAIIDDSIGWIIISIIFSLAQHGSLDLFSLARSVLGTALFIGVSLTLGRRLVSFLIRWTNDNFVSEVPVLSAILIVMGLMALTTHFIGVHTVLGAFVAGVLIGESPILTRQIDDQLRALIMALFAPVFFGVAGLGTDLTILLDPKMLLLTCGLIFIASVGKFGGAFVGGEIGGLNKRESFALALGMNARGSTEVIIATIGLSLGALSQDLFSMIVAMAVVTTTAMPPTLRWALRRVPLRKEEEERLEREAFEERGFVPNLERLLVAADESPNGHFASRLAGLLGGAQGMPITLLHIDKPLLTAEDVRKAEAEAKKADEKAKKGKSSAKAELKKADSVKDADLDRDDGKDKSPTAEDKAAPLTSTIEQAAESTRPVDADDSDKNARGSADVTVKTQEHPPEQAVAAEAKKGYDLLVIGVAETLAASGGFHKSASNIAKGFEGPLAIVAGYEKHLKRADARLNILVPVTGTSVSRRAAEVALALARAANAPVTGLFVRAAPKNARRGRQWRQAIATRRSENEILKHFTSLADNFGTTMKTTARSDSSPADAIVREAKRGGHDLIVMGVNRRPGDTLFFGDVAMEVLQNAECSILFVAGEAYDQERRPTEKEEVAT